jgi:hypothetical protein
MRFWIEQGREMHPFAEINHFGLSKERCFTTVSEGLCENPIIFAV